VIDERTKDAADTEAARQSIIQDGEMAYQFMQSAFYAWWRDKFDERIENNVAALHSAAGEADSFCQQMRVEDNVLKEFRDMPQNLVEAAANAAAEKPGLEGRESVESRE